jgi:Zinc finger, C2H2 type
MSYDEFNEKNECHICNVSFSKKYNLQRHLSRGSCKKKPNIKLLENPILSISLEDNGEKEDIVQCEYCNKLFDKNFRLKRHLLNSKGDCYKIRNESLYKKQQILNKCIFNMDTTNNKTINIQNQINNIQTNNIQTTNNITNILNIQPVIKQQIILAKHGEETISHITKDVMLEILNIESFPKMCTELMRLLYFNQKVPENRNWTIVYPRNQNAGVEYNHETLRFERKKTYNIIDDKFSNMVNLLFDLVQEISKDDIENNNLSKRQKINVNKYCMHFGQLDISKTSKEVYKSIHSLAYNSRIEQMKEWGENGHKGSHLSLKFN